MKSAVELEELNKSLLEWTIHFIKYKDAFHKNIKEITKEGTDSAKVTYKNKLEHVYCLSQIDNGKFGEVISKIQKNKDQNCHFVISCYNTKNNLDNLISNWQRLIEFPNLTIIFSNPNSQKDEKWMIKPNMHNKIIENGQLKQGLDTIYLNVDEFVI